MKRTTLAVAALLLATASVLGQGANGLATKMNDQDFFLDRKSLIGTKVQIEGNFQILGDILFMVLSDKSNATFIDIDGLPRDFRKAIHAECKELCVATITGKVQIIGTFMGPDVGIVADTFTIKQ